MRGCGMFSWNALDKSPEKVGMALNWLQLPWISCSHDLEESERRGRQLVFYIKVMSSMDRTLSLGQLRAASRVHTNFDTANLTTSAGKTSLL